jgi:hypothetical protein
MDRDWSTKLTPGKLRDAVYCALHSKIQMVAKLLKLMLSDALDMPSDKETGAPRVGVIKSLLEVTDTRDLHVNIIFCHRGRWWW